MTSSAHDGRITKQISTHRAKEDSEKKVKRSFLLELPTAV